MTHQPNSKTEDSHSVALNHMSKVGIDIIGLGPGREGLVSYETRELIKNSKVRIARTQRHPSISLLELEHVDPDVTYSLHYCDDFYETADTFEQVYESIARLVIEQARHHGHVLYCVPGSARVAEYSVELIETLAVQEANSDLDVRVYPATSFLDLAWVALGVDPVDVGVQILDAYTLRDKKLTGVNPVLISQCHSKQILSDIKLSVDTVSADLKVTVLQALGTDEEKVFEVPWAQLDQSFDPDHLSSLYVEGLSPGIGAAFEQFGELVHELRQRCPWDKQQTHASLRRYLLEESYETLEAIDVVAKVEDSDDRIGQDGAYEHLCEELGDLLFQIFFHAEIADEIAAFDVADVANGVYEKLYSRHLHIFNDESLSEEELGQRWEQYKKAEKQRDSIMDGITVALPSLTLCSKVISKANRASISTSELIAASRNVGDADSSRQIALELFDLVARSRDQGVDAESALRELVTELIESVRAKGI